MHEYPRRNGKTTTITTTTTTTEMSQANWDELLQRKHLTLRYHITTFSTLHVKIYQVRSNGLNFLSPWLEIRVRFR